MIDDLQKISQVYNSNLTNTDISNWINSYSRSDYDRVNKALYRISLADFNTDKPEVCRYMDIIIDIIK